MKCPNCVFSDILVQEGDLFSFINPLGHEVTREHPSTVMICRYNPPIGGDWPTVTEEDYCGKFKND